MAAWSHRPWYKVSTPEQKRALEAENWRRQISAQLFRAAHTQGEQDASEIIRLTGKTWERNPLGPKDDAFSDPLAPPEVQMAADREQAVTRGLQTQPEKRPGVPRGVAEAFPEEAVGRKVYDSSSSAPSVDLNASLVDNREGLPGPIRRALDVPVLGNVITEAARPANYVPIGPGGFARNLVQNIGGNLAAQGASDVAAKATKDSPPEVGFAAQLVAGLTGAVAGGTAADLGFQGVRRGAPTALRGAAEAATTYRDITQNIPVGASVKDVSGALPDAVTEPSIVERFTNVIQQAKPLRNQTARMQSFERGRRAGEFGALRTASGGEAGARSARGALSGELPKLQFDAPRDAFSQDDIDQLFDINRQFKWGPKQRFDQATVDTALFKTLSGQVPTQSEIKLMSKVYGADLANAILSKRGWGEKARENFYDVLNIPRTLASTVDFSGILRQGGFLVGHPTRLAKTVPAYVRATFSDSFAQGVDESIRTAPYATELEQAGLYIADRTRQTLGDREEAFMSRFLTNTGFKSRLTKAGVGAGVGYASGDTEEERRRNAMIGAGVGFASPTVVKASERGYVTFLNKLRSDVAHDIMKGWDDQYREQNIDRLARFVNAATGRGDLQELGNVGPALNAFFFSPRFLYSRFQLGAEAARSVATLNDPLSRTIAKDTVAFVGTGLAAMKLMQLSGQADVELDPRSSDFGKVKIGPTRYDFWGGYQQIARYTAQLITGERKTTTRGEITDVNRLETVGRFLQSKLSPTAGFAVDALRGESSMGEEITASKDSVKQQAWNRMAPLFIQDLTQAAQEEGVRGVIKTAPAGLGIGVQTFESANDIERRLAREMFPDTPYEQLNREQLRSIKQSPEMQGKLGESGPLQERAKAKYDEQSYDDAELEAGRMTPDEWKDRRTVRNAEYGGMLLAEQGDKPIQNPRNAYEEYLNVMRASRDQGGRIDFDKVEEWLNHQSPERQAQIEARSGLSDTPYVAERRAVSDELRKSGFFDIRDETWAEIKSRMNGKVRAEADQFASYDEYQQELVQQLAERLSRRMDPEIAYQRALMMINSHPAIGAFSELQKKKRALWARANNDLAQQAISFGFLSASELNIGASRAIRPPASVTR